MDEWRGMLQALAAELSETCQLDEKDVLRVLYALRMKGALKFDAAKTPAQGRLFDGPGKRRKVKGAMPAGFSLTAELRQLAAERLGPAGIDQLFETFVAHHQARGSSFVDWKRAWLTWVLNEQRWRKERGPTNHGSGGDNASRSAQSARRVLEDLGFPGGPDPDGPGGRGAPVSGHVDDLGRPSLVGRENAPVLEVDFGPGRPGSERGH